MLCSIPFPWTSYDAIVPLIVWYLGFSSRLKNLSSLRYDINVQKNKKSYDANSDLYAGWVNSWTGAVWKKVT
jgi:hypothetical protein